MLGSEVRAAVRGQGCDQRSVWGQRSVQGSEVSAAVRGWRSAGQALTLVPLKDYIRMARFDEWVYQQMPKGMYGSMNENKQIDE